MSSNSLKRSYSVGLYSVYVFNAKAAERRTASLRAFVSATDPVTGESSVIESFVGSTAEVDAINLVERLSRQLKAKRAATGNPIKALLNRVNQKRAVLAKKKADEARAAARLKAKMESEWNEDE